MLLTSNRNKKDSNSCHEELHRRHRSHPNGGINFMIKIIQATLDCREYHLSIKPIAMLTLGVEYIILYIPIF